LRAFVNFIFFTALQTGMNTLQLFIIYLLMDYCCTKVVNEIIPDKPPRSTGGDVLRSYVSVDVEGILGDDPLTEINSKNTLTFKLTKQIISTNKYKKKYCYVFHIALLFTEFSMVHSTYAFRASYAKQKLEQFLSR